MRGRATRADGGSGDDVVVVVGWPRYRNAWEWEGGEVVMRVGRQQAGRLERVGREYGWTTTTTSGNRSRLS